MRRSAAGAAGLTMRTAPRARPGRQRGPGPRAGMTVLELLLTVAIMIVVAVMMAPFMSDAVDRRALDRYSAEASDALREAQFSVLSGRYNQKFGVHFQGTSFVFFQGAAYSAGDANNVTHALPGDVTITSVSLSGGACTLPAGTGNCDVHFPSGRGIPTESGAIVFTGPYSASKTVTVGAAGLIDVN